MSGCLRLGMAPALAKLKGHMLEAISLLEEGNEPNLKDEFPKYVSRLELRDLTQRYIDKLDEYNDR